IAHRAVRLAAIEAVEEMLRRNAQRFRELIKAAGADAVLALLVFLHRLEADADPLRQIALGQAADDALGADARADVDIDRMGAVDHDGALPVASAYGRWVHRGHDLAPGTVRATGKSI